MNHLLNQGRQICIQLLGWIQHVPMSKDDYSATHIRRRIIESAVRAVIVAADTIFGGSIQR